MSSQAQHELWALELSNYFIKKHKYQLLSLTKNSTEMLLLNAKEAKYPIIVISTQKTDEINYELIDKHRTALAMLFETTPSGINISVNEESTFHDDKTIILTDSYLSNTSITSTFEGIDLILKPTRNVNVAMQRAQKTIRKNMTKLQRKKWVSNNIVTIVLSVILTAMFIATNLLAVTYKIPYYQALLLLGAYNKEIIVMTGQYYRFLTPMLLHGSVIHLLMNVLSMRNLGSILEQELGWIKYLATIVLGSLFGTVFLFVRSEPGIVIGISAGIYALLGVLLVVLFERNLLKNRVILMNVLMTLLINAYISLMPNVSMTGHLGGLYAGIILGFLFSKRKDWNHIRTASLVVLLTSMAYLVFLVFQTANVLL